MKLMSYDYKTLDKDGKHYESTLFTLGAHYKVERYVTTYEDGSVYKRISVEVSYEDRHENYIPKIYYDDDFFGERKPRFTIETTSYGDMGVDEIAKVIAGYKEAVEAVEILTKNFC